MRRLLAAGLLSASLIGGAAAPAMAAPPGLEKKQEEHFPLVCPEPIGAVQVVSGGGRSAWLNDRLYQAVAFDVAFTFTPPGGETEFDVYDKTFGRGPKGEVFTCTVDVAFSDPEEGTFTAVGTVTITTKPGGGRR